MLCGVVHVCHGLVWSGVVWCGVVCLYLNLKWCGTYRVHGLVWSGASHVCGGD